MTATRRWCRQAYYSNLLLVNEPIAYRGGLKERFNVFVNAIIYDKDFTEAIVHIHSF